MTAATRAVLAVDLGTGGAKAALVGEDASVLAAAFVPYPTEYPEPGRHEQRPAEWWRAVGEGARTVVSAHADAAPGDEVEVVAVALSGQSLALVPTDAELRPLLDAVPIWSDARAGDQARSFFERVPSDEWYLRTGNGFPPELYTVFEYAWYAEHRPESVLPARWLLGSKDWINARLTGEVATDHSYASGLGAYSLQERRYDDRLLGLLGIDAALLPPVVASTAIVGALTGEAAAHLGLPAGVPVVAGGVDNSCMALGAGLDRAGRCYLSLGSSNWLTVASPEPVLDATHRPYVFDHVLPGLRVSAFSTFGGGSSLNWLADLLRREVPDLLAEAGAEPAGSRGLVCVPTLAGGTVAEGGSDVRGSFSGLDLGHGAGTLTRSVLEGIAFSLANTADLLARYVELPGEILAVGGGARSALLLQSLADVLDRRVVRVANDQQSAALGAAALGFLGTGVWADTTPLDAALQATESFAPDAANRAALDAARRAFDTAAVAAKAAAPTLVTARRASVTHSEEHHAPDHR
ncbi:xylulokinase [Microbacterium aurantiacum]|uniref:Xylulokinase n=1 Tax=Microbacterium aurantiacum TaxID=162393 RepID=A0ABT8FWR2_9MICO|nr:FGGY family carbohydrate kinase [Microbacterium aurantiacum]MDN4465636.1 hypothetical protein [Microbacterium aurantiacum]